MTGSSSQKILSKDRLRSELGPLYRDEIVNQLMAFIEGVLDLEIPPQSDVTPAAQAQHVAYSREHSEDQIPELGSFFADNPSRLLFLSIISAGFYTLLWSYRHWRHYKRLALISRPSLPSRQNDIRIIPFWCAFFEYFYIVGAARRVRLRLKDLKIEHSPLRPWLVFVLFFLGDCATSLLQGTESIAANMVLLLIYFVLLYVSLSQPARLQALANRVLENENCVLHFRQLNAWDWIFIVPGAILFVLISVGLLVPPSVLNA